MTIGRRVQALERTATKVRDFNLTGLSGEGLSIFLTVLEEDERQPGATGEQLDARIRSMFADRGLALSYEWRGPLVAGGRTVVIADSPFPSTEPLTELAHG